MGQIVGYGGHVGVARKAEVVRSVSVGIGVVDGTSLDDSSVVTFGCMIGVVDSN